MTGDWSDTQSRYRAYCIAHGAESRLEMIERDRIAWPGGCMCGFLLWIKAQWRDWKAATGWRGFILSDADHEAFDRWLAARHPVPPPARAEPAQMVLL